MSRYSPKMGSKRYPDQLDASSLEYLRDHLKETPEKRKEYLQKLRKHFETTDLKENKIKVKITTEDDIPLAFLRSTKYNLEKSIEKVKNYYKMRAALPSVFTNRDPTDERMQKALKQGCFVPLRKLHEGRLVLIVRVSEFDPRDFSLEEILKMAYMILDVCNKICPYMQVHGACAIFDLSGMSFAHARLTTPSILRHMVSSWENYHCRPKQLEFINAPMFITVLLTFVRSLMSKKMKGRLRVHSGGIQSLLEFLPEDVLPLEYGGQDGGIDKHAQFWVEEITRHAEWFKFDEQFKVIE